MITHFVLVTLATNNAICGIQDIVAHTANGFTEIMIHLAMNVMRGMYRSDNNERTKALSLLWWKSRITNTNPFPSATLLLCSMH
jgi:hypothetical protein